MPSYAVTYFNARALAEPIRMILSYMGKEFKDIRISVEEWPQNKLSMPYGKVPILEIDNKVYPQASAICRYLAREAGLAGNDHLEDLEIDIISGVFNDFWQYIPNYWYETNEREKELKRQKLVTEYVPYYFGKFEHILKENKYLANRKFSWVDIFVTSYSQTLEDMFGEGLFDDMPFLLALRDEIFKIPSIQTWIDRRPQTDL